MKKLTKILTAALCLAAMLTFAACGGNKTEEENSYLIKKLLAFKDMRTVILMCYWG